MSSTEVIISPSATREIKKITKQRQKQVIDLLKSMENGSETLSIEKIKGHPSFFRVRTGDMRIVYHHLTRNRMGIIPLT